MVLKSLKGFRTRLQSLMAPVQSKLNTCDTHFSVRTIRLLFAAIEARAFSASTSSPKLRFRESSSDLSSSTTLQKAFGLGPEGYTVTCSFWLFDVNVSNDTLREQIVEVVGSLLFHWFKRDHSLIFLVLKCASDTRDLWCNCSCCCYALVTRHTASNRSTRADNSTVIPLVKGKSQ